jgi:hypothetical protein
MIEDTTKVLSTFAEAPYEVFHRGYAPGTFDHLKRSSGIDWPSSSVPSGAPSTIDSSSTPSFTPTTSSEDATHCPYVNLNFNSLSSRDYITDELRAKYGVMISAEATRDGYTPGGAARVFDTQNAKWGSEYKLASPNKSCGGKGNGSGGERGSEYENCDPLQNVLLVQNKDVPQPNDNGYASYITFDFDKPVNLQEIAIIESDGRKPTQLFVSITYACPWSDTFLSDAHSLFRSYSWSRSKQVNTTSGDVITINNALAGRNGVGHHTINVEKATQLKVYFPQGGAIADLTYTWCTDDTSPPTFSPDSCPVTHMDFDMLNHGTFVRHQLKNQFKLEIWAKGWDGAYTPNGAAIVVDTSMANDIDPDLGSPNAGCGGNGIGDAGKPGSEFENCDPLGKVLIVQGSNQASVDSHEKRGELIFRFEEPVDLHSFVIFDSDGPDASKTSVSKVCRP